jgi:hypothetical protein
MEPNTVSSRSAGNQGPMVKHRHKTKTASEALGHAFFASIALGHFSIFCSGDPISSDQKNQKSAEKW